MVHLYVCFCHYQPQTIKKTEPNSSDPANRNAHTTSRIECSPGIQPLLRFTNSFSAKRGKNLGLAENKPGIRTCFKVVWMHRRQAIKPAESRRHKRHYISHAQHNQCLLCFHEKNI
jgi:hypothetical protein